MPGIDPVQAAARMAAIASAPDEERGALELQHLWGRQVLPSARQWIEQFVKIEDKVSGKQTPFVFNRVQRYIERWRIQCKREGVPARAFILKSRHHGCSTYFLGAALEEVLRHNLGTMYRAGLVAQSDDTARELLENAKLMRDALPWDMPIKHDNRAILRFDKPIESKMDILSAKTTGVGRGKHYRFLHLTEVAFWNKPKESFNALAQTVPDDPGTLLTIESTANGAGGWFHEFFWESRKGKTGFTDMFFPWMWDDALRKTVSADLAEEIMDTLDDEERYLLDKFHVEPEQLAWRRHAIVNKCGGDLDLFHQEYPSTAEEAFILSGRPVFASGLVASAKNQTFDPIWEGDIVIDPDQPMRNGVGYRLVEAKNGPLKIWAHPKEDLAYCSGSDSAEGIGQDFSAISMLEVQSGCQVAEYASNSIKAHNFGDVCMALAQYYGNAYWLPETNNPGNATMQQALDAGYSRIMWELKFGRAGEVIGKRFGWRTTEDSKRLMVNEIANDLARDNETVSSEALAFQFGAYQMTEEGRGTKYSAPKGAHDDLLMARGIGLMCRRLLFQSQMVEDEDSAPTPRTESQRHWDEFEASLGIEEEEEESWSVLA